MKSLFDKLKDHLTTTNEPPILSQAELNLATAALLFEVATIDQHLDKSELDALENLLKNEFNLQEGELKLLIENAQAASKDSSSLYDFTQHINRGCSHDDKKRLVESLWKIAYADGNLDKYEEHIIRRIADLIHVTHYDFIQMKIKVRDNI
jgi:uncharacterized tellurite resistance protein B-like protein